MTGRYVMLRGWMKHPVFKAEPFTEREAWIWLIENAAWKATPHRFGSEVVTIERGQLAISIRQLADAWEWSVGRVERFVTIIKNQGMISVRSGTTAKTGKSVLTVCNYDEYQFSPEDDGGDLGTTVMTPAGQKRDTGRVTKEEGNKELFPPVIPPTGKQPKTRKQRFSLNGDEPMPVGIDEAKFPGIDIVAEWPRCRDYHTSRGTMIADLPATFRTWLGNQVGWAAQRAPKHAPTPTSNADSEWVPRLRDWRAKPSSWMGKWGPPPDHPRCQAPKHLLIEYGYREKDAA